MFWYNFCVYFSSHFVIIPNRSFAFINYSFPFVTSLHVIICSSQAYDVLSVWE